MKRRSPKSPASATIPHNHKGRYIDTCRVVAPGVPSPSASVAPDTGPAMMATERKGRPLGSPRAGCRGSRYRRPILFRFGSALYASWQCGVGCCVFHPPGILVRHRRALLVPSRSFQTTSFFGMLPPLQADPCGIARTTIRNTGFKPYSRHQCAAASRLAARTIGKPCQLFLARPLFCGDSAKSRFAYR